MTATRITAADLTVGSRVWCHDDISQDSVVREVSYLQPATHTDGRAGVVVVFVDGTVHTPRLGMRYREAA